MVTQIKEYTSAQAIADAMDKQLSEPKVFWANTYVNSMKSARWRRSQKKFVKSS